MLLQIFVSILVLALLLLLLVHFTSRYHVYHVLDGETEYYTVHNCYGYLDGNGQKREFIVRFTSQSSAEQALKKNHYKETKCKSSN